MVSVLKKTLTYTGWIIQVGVSYMFAQMSYMMYFMLSLSFTSLGETAILFQSLSHVLSVPLGDIMTRDYWLKKLQLAVFYLFFLSALFSHPCRFWIYTFVGHTCMKQVQLLVNLMEGHPSGGLIPLFFLQCRRLSRYCNMNYRWIMRLQPGWFRKLSDVLSVYSIVLYSIIFYCNVFLWWELSRFGVFQSNF